jgi:hypothetical protein
MADRKDFFRQMAAHYQAKADEDHDAEQERNATRARA